ncbi:MAG: hypothetical protein ACR2P0_07400 [Acidimicrobiales bacterium]
MRVALSTLPLLLVPLVAMQFTDEVEWTLGDFIVGGALLFSAGSAYALLSRERGPGYRAAVGLAVAAALLAVWATLAVGLP